MRHSAECAHRSPMERGLAPGGLQPRLPGEVALAHPRHLRAVGRGGPRLRDRLVAPARARLRQHDPGRVRDPGRVLRGDGHRQRPGRTPGRPRPVAVAAVRRHRADPRGGRRRDAIHVPGRHRAVRDRGGRARRESAAPGLHPSRALAPGACARDDPHGRDAADADPTPELERAPEPVVRAPLRGEHDRGDPGDAGRGPRADRAGRPDADAVHRRGVLGDRGRRGPAAREADAARITGIRRRPSQACRHQPRSRASTTSRRRTGRPSP